MTKRFSYERFVARYYEGLYGYAYYYLETTKSGE